MSLAEQCLGSLATTTESRGACLASKHSATGQIATGLRTGRAAARWNATHQAINSPQHSRSQLLWPRRISCGSLDSLCAVPVCGALFVCLLQVVYAPYLVTADMVRRVACGQLDINVELWFPPQEFVANPKQAIYSSELGTYCRTGYYVPRYMVGPHPLVDTWIGLKVRRAL